MLSEGDDLRHPHDPDPRWRESLYFNFLVPDASLGGVLYLRLDPNAALSSVLVIVYRGFEAEPAYFYVRQEHLSPRVELDDVLVAGLHIERVQPLHKFSLSFADGEAVALQLTFTSIHPPFDYARHLGGSGPALATNRFEQAGRVEGILRLGGKELPLSGFGQRDHSWGVRDWYLIQHYKWLAVQAGEKSALQLLYAIVRGEVSYKGYVFDGTDVAAIVSADVVTTYGPDAISHRHVAASIVDERGKTTAVEGNVYALTTVPMDRSLLFEGAGRFKVNGEPGAGIAEYLWHASYVDHVKKSGMDAAR
jgi:hypothetical protein